MMGSAERNFGNCWFRFPLTIIGKYTVTNKNTEPLYAVLCGSSLRIEYVANQDHDQIGPLCLNQ